MKKIKTRLYCAGGLGINIGVRLGTPEGVEIAYADTSESNKVAGLTDDKCYFIPECDGAGQDRRSIYQHVLPHIDPILDRHVPGDFNIVLFSASGGSGSVIGPLLVKALLEDGQTVVAVGVGADDSGKYLENTINSLKSLEAISVGTRKPVVLSYHENTQGVPRGVVDGDILFVLESLFQLTNQNNHELDTTDLANWTRYDKVSPVPAQLSSLTVLDSRQEAAHVLEPIAIASLYDDPAKRAPFGNPYYTTVGFPRDPNPQTPDQLHFVINIVGIDDIFKTLTDRQQQLNRNFSSYRQRRSVVDVDDNMTNENLVL